MQNKQRNVKNATGPSNTMRNAPRDTQSGNRDEAPDSRDVKHTAAKPKSTE